MGPVLNGLIKLQSIENQLRVAKAKLTRCRRSVVIQENQLRSSQNAVEAKNEEIQLTKVQTNRFETELKTRDEQIAKLRASLNVARTNREYAAVLTQLNTTKADNSKIENQTLELLKDIESDEAERDEIQKEIDEQKTRLEHSRKDAKRLAKKYEAEIEEIQTQWNKAAHGIPQKSLEIFKRVAETYDGQALAVVEHQDSKMEAFSCGGCFMGITAESVKLLMTKDEIIRCPNCTRILVLAGAQNE